MSGILSRDSVAVNFARILIALFLTGLAGCWPRPTVVGYSAVYPDKIFQGDSEEFITFNTGMEHRNYVIAPICLRLNDGEEIELLKLSEEQVKEWNKTQNELHGHLVPGSSKINGKSEITYRLNYHVEFSFSEGKLVACHLAHLEDGPLAGVQIGAKPGGEFLSFPIRLKDLTRVFGKPRVKKFTQKTM